MDRSTYSELLKMRSAGYVERYHTLRHIGKQTDAEHSAQAAVLLMMLHPTASVDLLKAVLTHDLGEWFVGDVPSPALRTTTEYGDAYRDAEKTAVRINLPTVYRVMNSLNNDERIWLRSVDLLELCLWCSEQLHLGNEYARSPMNRGLQYLHTMLPPPPLRILEFAAAHWIPDPNNPSEYFCLNGPGDAWTK